jgi:hypothetical protein
MRPQSYVLTSAVAGSWLPLNQRQAPFGVSVSVALNSTANLTYSVQHTFSDLGRVLRAQLSRATATVTVTTKENHGLVTNDSVIIRNANTILGTTGLDGTFTVTVTGVKSFTYTSSVTTPDVTGTTWDVEITPISVYNDADLTAKTTSLDSNYLFPVTATRLNVTSYVAGDARFNVLQGGSQ